MRIEILSASDQLLSAAFNGLYQGVFLTVLVALSLWLLRRSNAATRHAVWFSALLLTASLIAAHCGCAALALAFPALNIRNARAAVEAPARGSVQAPAIAAGRPNTADSDLRVPAPSDSDPSPPAGSSPSRRQFELDFLPLPPDSDVSAGVESSAPEQATPARLPSHQEDAGAQLPEAPTSREPVKVHWLRDRLAAPVSWEIVLGSSTPRITSFVLLACWFTIAGFRVSLLLWRILGIRRLKRGSLPPPVRLNEVFQGLRRNLSPYRGVSLKISPAHRSPVVLGFLHPVILLPAEEVLEGAEAEPVLCHELAHVRRRDDWANLAQQFVCAVLFFHPAVWWISKQLSLEREIACDDDVLRQGGRPRAYALLLANLAGRMRGCPPVLAPGVSTNKSQLQKRIDMILNTNRNTSLRLAKTRLGIITSAAAFVALAALYSAPRLVLAQNETAPAAAPPAPRAETSLSGAATPDGLPGQPPVALAYPRAIGASGDAGHDLPGEVAVASGPDSEDAPPATPPPQFVGAGPKSKPGSPVIVAPVGVTAPVLALTPPAPVAVMTAPAFPRAPMPMVAAVSPFAESRTPLPPRSPRPAGADSSFEERLERLEQMVESLAAQRDMKPGHLQNHGDRRVEQHVMLGDLAKQQAELAERQVEVANEQARRAAREFERAAKAGQKRQFQGKLKEGSQKQLEALHKQLEILEREKEKLHREIEKLERDQELLDEQGSEDQPRRSEAQPEQPGAKSLAQQPADEQNSY
jgi:beta-lactamase regulating signal transducer with metallopeptidase domain